MTLNQPLTELELSHREEKLKARMERLQALEKETALKEKQLKEKNKASKQVLLRLAPSLWEEIAAWAEEDFRSINGQIEFLLHQSVQEKRKRKENPSR